MRCLPLDDRLGGRRVQAYRRHQWLRPMPQRRAVDGYAAHSHPDQQCAVRGLPLDDQLHDVRRHRHGPHGTPGRHWRRRSVQHLPRDGVVSRHEAEHADRGGRFPPVGRTRQESSAHGRLRPVPRHEHLCQQCAAAGQSHSDQRAVRAVPHDGGQLRAVLRDRDPPGGDELPGLPRPDGGRHVCQHQDHHPARQSHSDRQPGLQRLGLPQHEQCERGWIQHRVGQHHRSRAERRRPHDRRGSDTELPDLSRGGKLLRDDRRRGYGRRFAPVDNARRCASDHRRLR